MLLAVRLDGHAQLDRRVPVGRDKLVVLELDHVAVLLGDHAGHAHQHARAVGEQHAHGEDAAALDEAVLHHARHGDHVHVAAGEDARHALALGGQVLCGGNREQAGVLDDHLVVLDHVEERDNKLIVVHADDVVEVLLQVREDLVAHLEHGRAVGDGVGAGELHHVAGLERRREACRAGGLHANDADLGVVEFGESRDAAGQAAAAHRHEDGVDQRQLLDDLHGDGALAGCHRGVVERWDVGEALLLGQLHGALLGVVKDVAVEDDLGAVALGALDLDERCGGGHDHDGACARVGGGVRHALRVVAGTCGDYAAVKLLLGELRDLVVRAAQLVGAGALHVLGLEPHAVAGRRREVRALNEFRLERDLFDFLGCLLESLKCEHLWHRDPYLRKGRDGVLQRVANLPRTRT